MPKIAVVFANGFEEIEGLTQVDIFRRLRIDTDVIGLTDLEVTGTHDITIIADRLIDEKLLDYDFVSLPGGQPGANNLRDSKKLGQLLQLRHQKGLWNGAICAGPLALAKFGLLRNTEFTCFPNVDQEILHNDPTAKFKEDMVVVDNAQHIITSRGPATAMAYAYKIAEVLGIDTEEVKQAMLYNYLGQNINK